MKTKNKFLVSPHQILTNCLKTLLVVLVFINSSTMLSSNIEVKDTNLLELRNHNITKNVLYTLIEQNEQQQDTTKQGLSEDIYQQGNDDVSSSQDLDEVVVVGYGTQKKSDVTGAIGKVGSKEILETPSFNAVTGLRGKVSGVNIFTNSGAPGGSNRVVIRGVGTINSSADPLYVVDGVAMQDFQFLNPNDIESMEVLKDASSTAIYGARGANGVILVTTKRGNKSEKMTVSYDSYYSIGNLRKKMDVMNSTQFMEVLRIGYANAPKYYSDKEIAEGKPAPVFSPSDPNLFDANGNPLYNTDWQEEATRTAFSQNHQLSIQQGGEKSSVGAFLNYTDNEGIMLNSYLKRLNAKIAYDVKPRDWYSFGINMLVNRTQENSVEEDGGNNVPRRTMIEMPSIFPVKFPDGTWSNTNMSTDGFGFESMANPVHVLTTQERLRERTQIFGNAALTFFITKDLSLKTQLGIDNQYRLYKNYGPTDLINISGPNGTASINNAQVLYWQEETFLNYNKTFASKHSLNGVLGLSWMENNYFWNDAYTEGFSDDFFKYNNMGTATIPSAPASGTEKWAMNSYFVRAGYSYDGRYLATVTARMDGSSKFGENNKYAFFPSVGLGWVVSKENFFKVDAINLLKFRTSYGFTGNSEIGLYKSQATISSGTALIDGIRQPSSYASRLPNPDLKWEKTAQFDIGFDLKMFNNRVGLEIDYYYKLTTDLLLDRPVPHSTGFTSVLDNIGSVSNRGIDFMLTTTNIETSDFSWTSSLNFNFNKNRIESLGANDEDIFPGPWWVSGSGTILRVGEAMGSFWGYTRLGTYSTAEEQALRDEAAAAGKEFTGPYAGTAKRSKDKSIIGGSMPDYTGSFINRLRYKNFDFLLDLQFVVGGQIMQQFFHSSQDRTGYANGLVSQLEDAWTPQNQNTMVQQIRNADKSGQSSELDSQWLADASYLRFNAIQLGYNFDNKGSFFQNHKISRLRLYSTLNNPWVFYSSAFKGYDPEATSNGNGYTGQNIFFFQYPKPTTVTFGLNVSF